ncbi:glypican-6 [Elysia marginata]|uniref:Glypican-6 n=1 Tax=Elysia marginata TaxID=1093978 RepID=A0AAV4J4E8_9GAST|nr:glypican-6 [Elysia marginata]
MIVSVRQLVSVASASDSYLAEVQEDGVLRQIDNPEVEVDVQMVESVFNRQKVQLQHITRKLNLAHKGEHVEWVDTGMDSYVPGSGSGDGMLYDDEDDDLYTHEDVDDDTDDGADYHTDIHDDYSDDEDDYLDSSGGGYQGSGSGSHGIVTDDERRGIVDIDRSPGRYTPTGGSGSHSGRGRGRGGNRDRYHHKKGGSKDYPNWYGNSEGRDRNSGSPGTFNNNRGTGGGNVPSILNSGGGSYKPNSNRNTNKNRGSGGRSEVPTAQEGGQGSGKDTASSSCAANVGVVLLLLGFHWLVVRRFTASSLSTNSC